MGFNSGFKGLNDDPIRMYSVHPLQSIDISAGISFKVQETSVSAELIRSEAMAYLVLLLRQPLYVHRCLSLGKYL